MERLSGLEIDLAVRPEDRPAFLPKDATDVDTGLTIGVGLGVCVVPPDIPRDAPYTKG
jgi:hypothetical protein